MKELRYTVRFNTPAFLGNAEQSGQWRTPPFKALLRQWWRVAYAAEHNFNVNVAEMRHEEGLLFGHAWLENDRDERGQRVAARKSLVRLRLDRWDDGKLKTWQPLEKVQHPEVGMPVGSDLYLGYGPVTLTRKTKQDQGKAAIDAGESALMSVAVPAGHRDAELNSLLQTNVPRIEHALWLMDRYGTLGGRSRNGWGSFSLVPDDETSRKAFEQRSIPLRHWSQCLNLECPGLDWPHAIGRDDTGVLVWQTKPFDDWKALMRELAIIKIGLRTQFKFPNKQPNGEIHERHWLSYPVTRHNVRAWDRQKLRLPNSLRFKVRPDAESPDRLRGVIFHVPCLPPPEFAPNRNAIIAVWQRVHALLDELGMPSDRRSYAMIADENRRSQLKSQLNSVSLTRIQE